MALDTEDIKTVESIVERFKPIAEEVSGLRTRKIYVHAEYSYRLLSIFSYEAGAVFINRRSYSYNHLFNNYKKLFGILEVSVIPEIAHHVHYNLSPYSFEYDSMKHEVISEGFAEYFSLNMIPDGTIAEEAISERKNELSFIPEAFTGYEFFKALDKELGKGAVFKILNENPHRLNNILPTSIDLVNPELYIQRRRNEAR